MEQSPHGQYVRFKIKLQWNELKIHTRKTLGKSGNIRKLSNIWVREDIAEILEKTNLYFLIHSPFLNGIKINTAYENICSPKEVLK